MANFTYIKSDGTSGTISANSADEALKTAPGISKNSGVMATPTTSPITVASGANYRETTIPEITGKIAKATATIPVPKYGSTVVDTQGNKGIAKFDPNTGISTASEDKTKLTELTDGTTSYDPEQDPLFKKQMSLLDQMGANIDAQTAATLSGIRTQYAQKYANLKDAQESQNASMNQSLLLAGSSRYAPVSSTGIMSAKDRYDLQTFTELQNAESAALTDAKKAQSDGQYQLASKKMDMYEKIRADKMAQAEKINQSLVESNKKIREAQIQSSRDGAISSLVSQGISEPNKILEYLNYDDEGNPTGGDFTLKEVGDALTNISKSYTDGDTKLLSGNIRDFTVLKENGALPGAISSLPENEQLKAFLNYIKPTKVTGVGTVKKITLASAKSAGLPLSTVGMSESELANSFSNDTAPEWFREKAQAEQGRSLTPEALQPIWESYRKSFNETATKKSTTKTTTPSTSSSSSSKVEA